ncbi:thioredoxin domain-containing protein [Synechococcus sp. PCC 7336]|uniref:thioredoxin domain-containing protein n=1 Tax=Synechococcus sp. PCC 7336 TaxID=195250 RepID=UPI0003481F0A|nr:thioredoxin domain-containing protein [Synechococcus sp. PCC 7336]
MTNRLAASPSLYLRKHAENPIDWWAWTSEALSEAKESDRPIFLSIGYSSCHWCTVMEGEAFSDNEISAYMNANFIPIKVDREERPDLDNIYMQSLQVMTGQGGWPLNVFLDPETLVPFYGGTYFPVERRYGRPAFIELLRAIRTFYDDKKEDLAKQQEKLMEVLQVSVEVEPGTGAGQTLLHRAWSEVVPIVSRQSMGQQFPMMPYAQLALRAARAGDVPVGDRDDALTRAAERGMDLVLGGIFDCVGGGFHRYTVDPTWTVPHFEKMLYDNGQILEFLANLWAIGVRDAAIARAIKLTVAWLEREMTAPEGYFYAAQDADSFATPDDREPEEGEFYVWRQADLEAALTEEEFAALDRAFFISEQGNFGDRPGYIVLQRSSGGELEDAAERALTEKLFAIRYGADPVAVFPPARDSSEAKGKNWPGRIPAVTDTKMIVAWNGLAISGLARAAQVFGDRHSLDLAIAAAEFIGRSQRLEDGQFARLNYDGMAVEPAKSEDFACFIKALLDIHQATLAYADLDSQQWCDRALALQQEMDDRLLDAETGGYFVAGGDRSAELIVREKDYHDNATPSGNGLASGNLVRLFGLTGDVTWLDRAERALNGWSAAMERFPRSCPTLFAALDSFYNLVQVKAQPEAIPELLQQFWPTAALQVDETIPGLGVTCLGLECLEPATSLEQLKAQVQAGQCRA